jgi:drug/metabolite transporter (DMT)-like permease
VRYVTTLLEVGGAVLLIGAGYVAFGTAAALALAGGACFGLSWALTRGGSA